MGTASHSSGKQRTMPKILRKRVAKTTPLHVDHAFLYISLPSLHGYDGKMASVTFYGGRKQATAEFSFSFYS